MDQGNPEEEVERLKKFWNEYGNSLIAGVVIGVSALFGWRYWQQHTASQAIEASSLYTEVMMAMSQNRAQAAREPASKIVSDYQSTPYAGLAALALARLDYDAGDKAGAEKQLRTAMARASDDAVRHAATLRLARLLLDTGKADEALSLVETQDSGGFEPEYAELRGDILLAKGDRAGARSAYQQAVKALSPESPYLPLLTMKLDDSGGATP